MIIHFITILFVSVCVISLSVSSEPLNNTVKSVVKQFFEFHLPACGLTASTTTPAGPIVLTTSSKNPRNLHWDFFKLKHFFHASLLDSVVLMRNFSSKYFLRAWNFCGEQNMEPEKMCAWYQIDIYWYISRQISCDSCSQASRGSLTSTFPPCHQGIAPETARVPTRPKRIASVARFHASVVPWANRPPRSASHICPPPKKPMLNAWGKKDIKENWFTWNHFISFSYISIQYMDQWPRKNLCSVCETPLFVGHVLRLHGSNSSSNTKRAEPKCLPVDRAVQGRLTHEISLVVGTWGLIGELALHHRSPWYREFRNPEILAKKVRPVTKGLRNPDCKPLHWWHSSAFSSVIAHLKWRQQTTIKSEDPLFTMLNEIWHCFITSSNIHASCSDRRSTGSYTHRLSCHDCLRLRAIIIKILQKNWPLLSSSVIWLHLNPQFQGRLRCRVARNLRMTEVTQLFGIFGARSPGTITSPTELARTLA